MHLLNILPYDRSFYETQIRDYLPQKIIDCHTHIWQKNCNHPNVCSSGRSAIWANSVAEVNPVEDLIETNQLLFPGKTVVPVLYSVTQSNTDLPTANRYVADSAAAYQFPALYLAHPMQSAEELEQQVLSSPWYRGIKVYLEYAPAYIPSTEIRIYDFLTPEHLAVANRNKWIVQLHIARPRRLADPVNYIQILEIEQKYPDIQFIIAHLGRAYADEDVGDALTYLKHSEKTLWDFTANTNQHVMELVLNQFGAKRFLYGSDFPIFRMKARRHTENGFYINEIPAGSIEGAESDPHLREISGPDADSITFFIYEEIASCRKATENLGLSRSDVEAIFWGNAARIFGVGENV